MKTEYIQAAFNELTEMGIVECVKFYDRKKNKIDSKTITTVTEKIYFGTDGSFSSRNNVSDSSTDNDSFSKKRRRFLSDCWIVIDTEQFYRLGYSLIVSDKRSGGGGGDDSKEEEEDDDEEDSFANIEIIRNEHLVYTKNCIFYHGDEIPLSTLCKYSLLKIKSEPFSSTVADS